ncbi:DUF4232 domain-containing protein [Streptomyces sp. NRRL S-87]|uniref:DUF4232 domain-containing protein n=1 Tax=Streptomyces sp. NRRL S-87 TaxID=1463920 RepID=UPI0004C0982B|nr:DUF4232 domain-containing protein [Streptomyces sp. NRRL S-87]
MQYTAGIGRTAAALVTAAAAAALMTGCTPAGDDGASDAPSTPPAASGPAKPTATAGSTAGSTGGSTGGSGGSTGGSTSGGSAGTSGGSSDGGSTSGGSTGGTGGTGGSGGTGGTGGGAKPCGVDDIEVSEARQAENRPDGTGTGAAIVSVTNTSSHTCTLRGFPTVAGAGNGSPDKNRPLAVTRSGTAAKVPLAPGGSAWTKLTFVQVQGEADGYCVSGATPSSYPTIVLGVPDAGKHQIAMVDGVFAECDDTVTVTAFSSVKPS